MAVQIGYINNLGLPAIKIRVSGAYPQVSKEIDAVIDTGTISVVLADGNTQQRMVATCSAFLGEEGRSGTVILEPASRDVLLGMTFLNIFKKTLFVQGERKTVALIDNADADSYAATLEVR